MKVLDTLVWVTRATDISFRKVVSEATFAFTHNLIPVRPSIPRTADDIANAGDLLDRFCGKRLRLAVIEQVDRKLNAHLAQIREFQSVNILVDAGTMHSLTVTHWFFSNFFH
jgi:hypothetical protein